MAKNWKVQWLSDQIINQRPNVWTPSKLIWFVTIWMLYLPFFPLSLPLFCYLYLWFAISFSFFYNEFCFSSFLSVRFSFSLFSFFLFPLYFFFPSSFRFLCFNFLNFHSFFVIFLFLLFSPFCYFYCSQYFFSASQSFDLAFDLSFSSFLSRLTLPFFFFLVFLVTKFWFCLL